MHAEHIERFDPWTMQSLEAMAPCAIENLPVALRSTLLIRSSTPSDSVNPLIKLYKLPWISLVQFFTWVIYFMTIFFPESKAKITQDDICHLRKYYSSCHSIKNRNAQIFHIQSFENFEIEKSTTLKKYLNNRMKRKFNKVSNWDCIEKLKFYKNGYPRK